MKRPAGPLLVALPGLVAAAGALAAGGTPGGPGVWLLALAAALLLAPTLILLHRQRGLKRALAEAGAALAAERARFDAGLIELGHDETRARAEAAQYRAVFEQAAVGVAEIETATGFFVRINPRLCDILGLTAAEALGRDCKTLTHPDDLPANWTEMRRLLTGEIRRYCLDQRYLRPDGSVVWVALEVSALWEPEALPDHHLAVVQDISVRKANEFALRRARAEAERLLEEAEASRRALLSLLEDQEAAARALRASEDRHRSHRRGRARPARRHDPRPRPRDLQPPPGGLT